MVGGWGLVTGMANDGVGTKFINHGEREEPTEILIKDNIAEIQRGVLLPGKWSY
jgi:hypothetical protein